MFSFAAIEMYNSALKKTCETVIMKICDSCLSETIVNEVTSNTPKKLIRPLMKKISAHYSLILNEDHERFKDHVQQRLIECGWMDKLKIKCYETLSGRDPKTVSLDKIVSYLDLQLRPLVPDYVKKELKLMMQSTLLLNKLREPQLIRIL